MNAGIRVIRVRFFPQSARHATAFDARERARSAASNLRTWARQNSIGAVLMTAAL